MFTASNGLQVSAESSDVYTITPASGPGFILARYAAKEKAAGMPMLWTVDLSPVDPGSADGSAALAALSEYLTWRSAVVRLVRDADPWSG